NPEVMGEYFSLQHRQQFFRNTLDEMADRREQEAAENVPNKAEMEELQAKIDDPDTTTRLRKKYEARMEEMQTENDAYIKDATSRDTEDMSAIRQALVENDLRMRDLAPQVSETYRRAEEFSPRVEESEEAKTGLETSLEPISTEITQEQP